MFLPDFRGGCQREKASSFFMFYLCVVKMPVYLDYNATTPVHETVLEKMLPFYREQFGNASSHTHAYGWSAAAVVEQSREAVAGLINCEPAEIIFTSGATEAINLAIKGITTVYREKGNHVISCVTEHKAVLDTLDTLQHSGFEVTLLPVNREGLCDPEDLKKAIRPETILVAVMLANNETGVIQPIEELAQITHHHGAIFFSDTTQATGKIRVDVQELGIDVCSISAHKMYGPKGVGALFVRRKKPRVNLFPLLHGGGHENGRRSGTLNVPGIVGLGAAAQLCESQLWEMGSSLSRIRTRIEQLLTEDYFGIINGSTRNRLYNTANICFPGISAQHLIKKLPQYAFSLGSACTSAVPEPSHVLTAMGLSTAEAAASIRLSFGMNNTTDDIDPIVHDFKMAVTQLREQQH